MGKIRSLTEDEAGHLRSSLLKSYRERFGRVFIPVTYLGAYEEFRDMLLSGLPGEPGVASSISPHRLRKLFYYTDPAVCPSGQLEPLTFGDDFISLLEKYCLENSPVPDEDNGQAKPEPSVPVKKSRTVVYLASTVLIVLLTYLSYRFYPRPHYSFRDDFQFNSVEDLKKRGWDFIDFDSSLFYPQDTGVLTLRSARGDYWVRPYDTPYIKNLIYRKLPKDCFEVVTSFTFPNNFEAFQQCGIYILDSDLKRNHNIRMTYAQFYEKNPELYTRGYQIVKREFGQPTQFMLSEISIHDTINYVFNFKIVWHDNQFYFYYYRDGVTEAYIFLTSMDFDFEPKFIALVSFNGYRNVDRGPLNIANSIPARFDWVRVEGCE